MRFKTYLLAGFYLLFSGWPLSSFAQKNVQIEFPNPAYLSQEITRKDLQTHVEFLSSDALEGRLTGTLGEKLAAQYIAAVFHYLGLEPAGDNGTFFQDFNFTAGISLGKNNTLVITNQKGITRNIILDQEWRPLSFSDPIDFESTQLVFAGYGISAPPLGNLPGYDSYRGLNVKNKWVVVFRYLPEKISETRRHHLSQYASLRYKAFTAKEHGAKGIVFISGPNSSVKHELIPLSFDTSLSGSGIVALSIKDDVLNTLINDPLNSLQKVQNILDAGQMVSLPILTGIKFTGHIDIKQNKQQGRNVLAKLRIGAVPTTMIIVGAHLDHLGRGELSGSRARENEKGLIHYGADDNASGVAAILEAAIKLSRLKAQGKLTGSKDILFAAWSGEELGILGSSHFVQNLMKNNKMLRSAVNVDINLDMVGRLSHSLVLQGIGSSSKWPTVIARANVKYLLPLITQNDPYLPTDSTAFYLHGIPTLNFFTGAHDEYHTPRDKPGTINYEGLKSISEFLVSLILAVENEPNLIDYREVQKTGGNLGRGFRVYLGTIPDYAKADVLGVRLSGVTKDSPAEHAGVKQDDIIIELAGKKIHDIYDYSFVLSALPVGKPVKLIVRRGQSRVDLTIIARYRE
jgi:hypothetical protein